MLGRLQCAEEEHDRAPGAPRLLNAIGGRAMWQRTGLAADECLVLVEHFEDQIEELNQGDTDDHIDGDFQAPPSFLRAAQ